MKVSITPSINYHGRGLRITGDGEEGDILNLNIPINTRPFTIDIPTPKTFTYKTTDGRTIRKPLSTEQFKTWTTNRIKNAVRRRLEKVIKDNLYSSLRVLDESNYIQIRESGSAPIIFYLEDNPEAKVGQATYTQDGFDNWIRNNFTTNFMITRTSSTRRNGIYWGQERVWYKAPPQITYNRTPFYQQKRDDLSCGYDYIVDTFGTRKGFIKTSRDKKAIDKAIELPQDYHKQVYNEWLCMYKDNREIEKLIENKSHPLPQIVDIDDLQDDLYNVIDINCEREYTDDEIDKSLSILDIVKYCIVSKIRLSVLDYDNSIYCSYDPNVFRAIHKKISGNIKHTILVRVENNHAYFITDKNLKTSISLSITNVRLDYVNTHREDLESKNKKLDVGLEPVDIEYHTTYPLDTNGTPIPRLISDDEIKQAGGEVEFNKREILKMVK